MTSRPIKRSAVHHLHVREHATFTSQHGWEIAASFGDPVAERATLLEGVGLADVSWLGKLECKGPWAATLTRQALGGATACPVTPERLLWVAQPALIDRVLDTLERARAGQPRCYLIDVSPVYASYDLVGPWVTDVLCKVSPASPEIGIPIFAPVDGVRSLLVRHDRGLQIHFQREFGEYLWESLLDAGEEFGIRRVGVEALAPMQVGA